MEQYKCSVLYNEILNKYEKNNIKIERTVDVIVADNLLEDTLYLEANTILNIKNKYKLDIIQFMALKLGQYEINKK